MRHTEKQEAVDWLDLSSISCSCSGPDCQYLYPPRHQRALGREDGWRFLYFWNMRVRKKYMVTKAKRKKESCSGPTIARLLQYKCCLVVPRCSKGPPCPSAETHLPSTGSRVFSQLRAQPVVFLKLSLTYPTVIFSFSITAVFTACLLQTGWGKRNFSLVPVTIQGRI